MKRWIEFLKKNEVANCRLFCFHHGGGGSSTFFPWSKKLSSEVELIAIQLPGRESRFNEPYSTSIESVITNLFDSILNLLEKPMIFFGHSFGGLLAFELTCRLHKNALPLPKHFIVSGCKAPHLSKHQKSIGNLSEDKLIAKLIEYNGIPKAILQDEELLSLFLPTIRADFKLFESYQFTKSKPLPYHITALHGKNDPSVCEDDVVEWQYYTSLCFRHFCIEGDHFFIKSAENEVISVIQQIIRETALNRIC